MKIGAKLPNLNMQATGEQTINLAKIKGKNVVVYFYPKDSTPGCTTEGQDFRDRIKQFEALNCVIFGVSRDSIKSHEKFKEKQEFPFELLSDPEEKLCKKFDVIKLKKLYGKEYLGIERSTFLFNEEGKLTNEWRKLRVKGHVEEVLQTLEQL